MNNKPTHTSHATTNESGQVLALFALFLVVFLGFAALTIDYGSWLKARRDYQNAADSAVLAGSAFLSRPIDNTKRAQAREAAWQSLKQQLGLSLALNPSLWNSSTPADDPVEDSGYRLWVSTPPIQAGEKYPGGYRGATDRYLFALVEKDNPTFFARIFGQGNATVGAWATAGSYPGRFAVITLRQNGQDGPMGATDITLNGNNSNLEVIDGDVGGNWGMKLTASAQLWLRGSSDNEADAYLIDYTSCGNSCWSPTQVNSGPNGNPTYETKAPQQLPEIIEDPNYVLPSALTPPPNSPVAAVPLGDDGDGPGPKEAGDIDVRSGGPYEAPPAPGGTTEPGGVLTCPAGSPRIGPGYYTNITVRSGKCLVLDPVRHHTSVSKDVPDVPTPVTNNQLPGIFYVNGNITVEQDAMIVGDGVTIIVRPASSNQLLVRSGGVLDLNRGTAPDASRQELGAWMPNGTSPYSWDEEYGLWDYSSSLENNLNNVGIAIYVIKRAQYSSVANDDNSNVIKINAGAGLAWNGVTYAPHDNIDLAGQPGHDGIGQLVAWTLTFSGGVPVKQLYDGPDQSLPRLVEPHLGQ